MINVYQTNAATWKEATKQTSELVASSQAQHQFKVLDYEVQLVGDTIKLAKDLNGQPLPADWNQRLEQYHKEFDILFEAFRKVHEGLRNVSQTGPGTPVT